MNKVDVKNCREFKIDCARVKETVLHSLGCFNIQNSLLQITFVPENEIRTLNHNYRKIDSPTDVLSFPQIDLPSAKIRLLGDIVISPSIVASKQEQLDDVIKHGILHLLGFDHETDEKEWGSAALKIDCHL